VRVYRQRFSARCLVAGTGATDADLERLRNEAMPEQSVARQVRRAQEVAPYCYRITRAPSAPWQESDRLVALLQVGDTVVGDIQASKPCPDLLGPDRLEWLGIFVSLVDQVLAEHAQAAADYQAGKDQALGALVGEVMARSGRKANPKVVNQLLRERLPR